MDDVVEAAKTSVLAVWSLILGILSLVCIGFIAGIPAVICGHLARAEIRRSSGSIGGSGMALAGLITGYIGTVMGIIVMIIAIISAIALPSILTEQKSEQIEQQQIIQSISDQQMTK